MNRLGSVIKKVKRIKQGNRDSDSPWREIKIEVGHPIVGDIWKTQIMSGGLRKPVLGTYINTKVL
jgi:hypothetical protein